MRTLYKSHGTKEAEDSAPGPESQPASRISWLSDQLGGLDSLLLDLRFLNIRQKQNRVHSDHFTTCFPRLPLGGECLINCLIQSPKVLTG